MIFRWLGLLFLFVIGINPPSAQALHVVKITSEDPSGTRTLVGSAVVIGYLQSYPFLLTSDHVFFHSNAGYLHQFYENGNPQAPRQLYGFLAADWGKGLGLFSARHAADDRDLKSEFCSEDHPVKAQFIGFPSESYTLVASEPTFKERISAEDYFSENKWLDVYTGGLAEYGMSGGALYDAKNDCLAGIISHQRKAEDGSMETLVIPVSEIKTWYTKKATARKMETRFFEEVDSQIGPQKSVVMGDMRFYLFPIPHREGAPFTRDVLATTEDRSHPGESIVLPYRSKISSPPKDEPEAPPTLYAVPLHESLTALPDDDEVGKMKTLTDLFEKNCSYLVPRSVRKIMKISGFKNTRTQKFQALEQPGLVNFFSRFQDPDLEISYDLLTSERVNP